MTRSLVLCADDYGLSAGINQAILELIERGRLSATSCMTTMPGWHTEAASALLALQDKAALGLHFNLTEGTDAIPLGRLMLLCLTGRLDKRSTRRALEQQLDRFEQLTGRPPDFVDGHQHIQMFPGIREVLLNTLTQRYGRAAPWVRVSSVALTGHDAGVKAGVLNAMGIGFNRARRQRNIRGTLSFAGMYSLQPEAGFDRLMQQWLEQLPDGALIMCHPGYTASQTPLEQARAQERDWLGSDAFQQALQQHQRILVTRPRLD